MTSGSHQQQQQQFPGWEGEEGDADFMSEFFGSLTPDYSNPGRLVPTSDTAVTAQEITTLSVGVGLEKDYGKGGGFNEEEVGSSVNKFDEVKLKGTSTSGTKQEVTGGSCESQPKRKRNRTSEMHNMTERKRRDKIKGKLKALQELIPNCHKLDRASLLDEAVSYVKALQTHANALQMQVQLLTGGGVCMPPSPNACYHMPHMSPFSRMGMGYHAMGMGYPVGHAPYMSPLPSSVRPVVGYSPYPSFSPISQQAVQFSTVPEYATSIPSPPILQPGPFGHQKGESSSLEAVPVQKQGGCEPMQQKNVG